MPSRKLIISPIAIPKNSPSPRLLRRSRTSLGQSVHIPSLENECPTVAGDGETNYESRKCDLPCTRHHRRLARHAGSRRWLAFPGHDSGRKIGQIHLDRSWLSFALTEPCPQGLSSERASQEFLPARLVILIQILRTNRVGYGGTVDNSDFPYLRLRTWRRGARRPEQATYVRHSSGRPRPGPAPHSLPRSARPPGHRRIGITFRLVEVSTENHGIHVHPIRRPYLNNVLVAVC